MMISLISTNMDMEGLDVKYPNHLWIVYHLSKWWILMYKILDIL